MTFNDCNDWDGYDSVDVMVMGAVFDLGSPTSAGQRHAPHAIREAGHWESGYSLQHDVDWVNDLTWADYGDVAAESRTVKAGHEVIRRAVSDAFDYCKTLIVLGGDHSITLPILRAYEEPPVVVHFDAHHDYTTPGTILDHGSWVTSAVTDGLTSGVLQYGCRGWGYTKAEHERAKSMGIFVSQGFPDKAAMQALEGHPVHLSIDMDVCDPGVAPGVVYQEPGGWDAASLLEAVLTVVKHCNVRSLDITEVVPHLDSSGITSRLANRVIAQAATGICLSGKT